jgi:lipopolysaccharide/colanic/teichoic acid biosynthesis glycosyltransferase
VFLVVHIAVLVSLGRPVLHKQLRVGKYGREFVMPKYRTMGLIEGSTTRASMTFATLDSARHSASFPLMN